MWQEDDNVIRSKESKQQTKKERNDKNLMSLKEQKEIIRVQQKARTSYHYVLDNSQFSQVREGCANTREIATVSVNPRHTIALTKRV